MKTATTTITVKVTFEYDETRNPRTGLRTRLIDAAYYAQDLAINPNMSSVLEGVQLVDYETSIDDYENLN